jgi:hypothetical protein
MMETLAARWDRNDLPMPRPRIAIESLAGRWFKTNPKTQWIDSLHVETNGDRLFVEIFGGTPPSPQKWGRAEASILFAGKIDDPAAPSGAFIAHYTFDALTVEVEANLNLGLLVVATYVTLTDEGADEGAGGRGQGAGERGAGERGAGERGAGLPPAPSALPPGSSDRFTREFFFRGGAA